MKLLSALSIVAVLFTAFFLRAQGRGKLIKMERKEVVTIASSLKKGMSESEAREYLAVRGLEADWSAIEGRTNRSTNVFMVWYLYGTNWSHFENLLLVFHARQALSFAQWQAQHLTNSLLVSADVRINDPAGTLIPISLTNAP